VALVDVGHFSAAKHDRNDHLVFVGQECSGLVDLELNVMVARFGPQPYFLEFRVMNVRFVLLLLLLVLELAKVHDAADRWRRPRSDFHQVKAGFSSAIECFGSGQNP